MDEIEIQRLSGVTENVRFRMPSQLTESACRASRRRHLTSAKRRGIPKGGDFAAPKNSRRRAHHGQASSRGQKRYPLVLMLEPLFRCNLACAGCGKIDYPDPILNQRLSVAQCLEAVDECGAPIVVYWPAASRSCIARSRRLSKGSSRARSSSISAPMRCCSKRRSTSSSRTPYFAWTVHLDGDKEDHDHSVCLDGVCATARSRR